jgi:hypothetical protein
MRPFLISILTVFCLISSAQSRRVKIFHKTEYINGNFNRQLSDTINATNEPVDIYFFKRHFFSPYYLPEKFIDQQSKNKTISVWRDPNGKKDYLQNWENTYTYDSLGRVINYTYSGCFICSNTPYNYTVTYNSIGQVDRIFSSINVKDGFKFYYNKKGDIIKFEEYLGNKVETEIKLVD